MSVLNESRPFGVPCSPDLAFLLPLADYLAAAESGHLVSRAGTGSVPMISLML